MEQIKSTTMELRIWKYGEDDNKIASFLHSASVAHNIPQKSEAWFHWKFEKSPYGKSIIACAFEGGEVVGCVALGRGLMQYNGKSLKCALSYETFVHPSCQGKGLFKKLISLAEDACRREGIDILYNFPNSNSLPGFKKMGWKHIPKYIEYKISLQKPFRCLSNYKSIVSPFQPIDTNNGITPTINCDAQDTQQDFLLSTWSREYIHWRFFELPHSQYIYLNENNIFAIARVGYRGKLKECQILHIAHDSSVTYKYATRVFCKHLKRVENPDLISICCSKKSFISKCTKAFIKVPTNANFTYKILNDKIAIDDFVISGIDFHTY